MELRERTRMSEYPEAAVPGAVTHGATAAMAQGETHYGEVAGVVALREAIGRFLSPFGLFDAAKDTVIVTAGEQAARFLAIHALAGRDAPLALPAVVHPGVRQAIGVRRLATETIPVDAECQPTLEGIESACAAGCRTVYLETPNRLTGALLPAIFITELAAILARYDAYAIVDIGLAPFTRPVDRPALAALARLGERAVYIGTPWPGFGADAWQVGFLAGSAALVRQVTPLKQIAEICTCVPAQWGVRESEAVYEREQPARLAMYWAEGDGASELAGADALPGSSATVLAVQVADAAATAARLAARGLPVTDGTPFGASGVVRVLISGDGAATAAVRALKEG